MVPDHVIAICTFFMSNYGRKVKVLVPYHIGRDFKNLYNVFESEVFQRRNDFHLKVLSTFNFCVRSIT